MKYVRIKVSFHYAPESLYRILLVPEHVELPRLAQIIGESMHVAWEHLFQFSKGNTYYLLEPDNEFGGIFCNTVDEQMADFTIDVLGESAKFEYDFGDGWDFDLRIYKRLVEREEEKAAWILEGKGQGVWEDNIGSLFAYLGGEIDDNYEEDEDEVYCLPWNFENTKFSDFDAPLNLEEEQKSLDEALEHEPDFEYAYDDDDDDDDDDYDDDWDDTEHGIDQEAIARLFEATEGLDYCSAEKDLDKWLDKSQSALQKRYGEPIASTIILRLLIEKQIALTEDITKYL